MKHVFQQYKRPLLTALCIILWLGIWELAALLIHNSIFLPTPFRVLTTLFSLGGTAAFWSGIGFTTSRIVLGFLIGICIGFLCGVSSLLHPFWKTFLSIPMKVIRAVPVASFVILALLWVDGQGLTLLIVACVTAPLLYQCVLDGATGADAQLQKVSALYHAGFLSNFRNVLFPAMLPALRAGLSSAAGLAFKSGVAAEIIGLIKGSVGNQLYQSKLYLETPELFAWTLAIILVSVLFELLLRGLMKLLFRKYQ